MIMERKKADRIIEIVWTIFLVSLGFVMGLVIGFTLGGMMR